MQELERTTMIRGQEYFVDDKRKEYRNVDDTEDIITFDELEEDILNYCYDRIVVEELVFGS